MKPKISIVTITYGHEKFIEETIRGVLMQQYDGPIEFIISNDNSPDQTDEVVTKYLENNTIAPNIEIKYTNHQKNKGAVPNSIWALEQVTGKYLAMCEGDDYWTDPLKLQKQVDFLETHPDYNATVGRYKFYYEASGTFKDNREIVNIHKPLTLKDYIAFNFSHTSTFVLRMPQTIPDWFQRAFAGDQSLFIISTGDKKIKYFEDFFSVYRINQDSITGQFKRKDPSIAYNNTDAFLNHVNEHTQFQFEQQISRRKQLNKLFFKMDSASNKIQSMYYKGLIYLYRWYIIKKA